MTIEEIIITPPIVGVPCFFICPSKPKFLTISPTCFNCKYSIIFLPKTKEIKSDMIKAIEALNDGQNVWIESHIWDEMEYDFNHELEQWWSDVYDDLHSDKVDELINDGYEYDDE